MHIRGERSGYKSFINHLLVVLTPEKTFDKSWCQSRLCPRERQILTSLPFFWAHQRWRTFRESRNLESTMHLSSDHLRFQVQGPQVTQEVHGTEHHRKPLSNGFNTCGWYQGLLSDLTNRIQKRLAQPNGKKSCRSTT